MLFICDDEFDVIKKITQILSTKKESLEQQPLFEDYKNKADDFMQQHQGVTARLLTIISKLLG